LTLPFLKQDKHFSGHPHRCTSETINHRYCLSSTTIEDIANSSSTVPTMTFCFIALASALFITSITAHPHTPPLRMQQDRSLLALEARSRHPFEPETIIPTDITGQPVCTISTELPPMIEQNTLIIWNGTATVTSTISCSNCALVWSTGVINYFAPIIPTATVTTFQPSTRTVLACSGNEGETGVGQCRV
jgi:hypothetical protein